MKLLFSRILRIARYSFCPAKVVNRFYGLSDEEKCDYVIATYCFSFYLFVLLLVAIFASYPRVIFYHLMKNPIVIIQIIGVIFLGIARLTFFTRRRIDWDMMVKDQVIADKISLALQVSGIVLTLFVLCGAF
jgi:hypothetical protein